ncbi:receptor-type tyrosine-protein phosphatase C-like isoform X7 [Tenebrio molitor]|uniref:receptor-type tyrosine-protein phosphatase C-like isoform X6 n=1 Tax=Tenebrio molitor TaxID=7067 RepID=UPI0036246CCE
MATVQWHHFKVKDSKICDYNDTIINQNVTQFYEEISKKDILKLHEYKYLYTNESKTETIYTNTKNCVLISEGCFSMHLAMCRGCNITIQLNSNRGTINKEFSGTGGWKKEQFPLENFDTCFNISTTSQLEHGIGETFWAIGEVIYLSSNLSCKENKRYLRIANHTSDYICENAVNEKINIASSLADNRKKYCDPYTMSSNDYLYLFTVLPVVLITSLIACCSICLIRKTKFKRQFKSEDIPSNKIDKMQEITLLNFTEDQNEYQIIYNDGWKKVCRKDYLQYVKLAFEPSCTHLDIQFSNIPTGNLKDNKESLKKKNILKNQDQSILPYDVNRVKLNNKNGCTRRPTDYINASYVQISDNEKEYIVTQNPLENTTADFWDMIWQENVNHIIMITSPNEKFVYYWPKLKGDLVYFDDIRVSLKEICNDKFYIHRRLQVQRNGKSRQIDQLHYNLWEIDNDLSLTSRTSKEFMNHLLKIPHHVAPVVVHSKNGTGRCGTIVLCDAVLRALPITDKIDLYGFTVKLRNVRANMVSDLEQFKLAHLIVRDMVS